ncbi:CoA transferase [Ensifer adhaerens]|uniref:CoA transferase n=1 Tax=Ensifer adhaerens TaxID=106592 RepID=UPI001CBDC4E7|nr:CoA transferase [Ensifer adhaerens]MBZ7924338.1 CoA transferase [Ensifer adhaerens]UAX96413.1 CoA transferase [Ensifer adhaerens]UAY04244.1 CoA transferase [Ensifer adhaerens]UAY12230.1 CoA transferase [Ensifer adhaerens]
MYELLSGLRIIEISAFVAMPLCGNTLAQLGAEVIRVDPPGGGVDYGRWPLSDHGGSIYWSGLNHGKRSVTADLRTPEGEAFVLDLIGDNGIVITNLSPAFLTDGTLLAERPKTILATLEGFPSGRTGVDYTINAASGLPLITGSDPTSGPINSPFPTWDMLAGLHIALAIVAAERRRRLEGQGAWIKCALSDVMLSAMTTLGFVGETEVGGSVRQAIGNNIFGTFGHDFQTADGRRLMVVALTPRQWQELCKITGTMQAFAELETELGFDFKLEGDRFKARDRICAVFADWFATRNLDDIASLFEPTAICWHPYQTIDALRKPGGLIEESAIFERVVHQGVGEIWTSGPVFRLDREVRGAVKGSGTLGADTDAFSKNAPQENGK